LAQFVLAETCVDMRSTFILSAKNWFAIGLVICVLAAFALSTGQLVTAITAFGTAAIAAFDSTHVYLPRYKTWLPYGPIGLFVLCALIWPFALIWYSIVRIRIARETMPVRRAFVQNPT
jgi:Zn-dependent protease